MITRRLPARRSAGSRLSLKELVDGRRSSVALAGFLLLGSWALHRQLGASWPATILGVTVIVFACALVVWLAFRSCYRSLADLTAFLREADSGLDVLSEPVTREARSHPFVAETVALLQSQRTLIEGLGRLAERMTSESRVAFETGVAITQATESTAGDAAYATDAAARVSDNMYIVASASEELAATIEEVAARASQVSARATSAAAEATRATETVAKLGATSARIGDISGAIARIAAQSHLLALNATIEAASAGRAGAGFAVVADEVKVLAGETAELTKLVSANVEELQVDSANTAEAIQQIRTSIDAVSGDQSAIAAAVEQQTAATREIGRAAVESADASLTIVHGLNELGIAVRRIAFEAARADTKAGDFALLQLEIQRLVDGPATGQVPDQDAEPERSATAKVANGTITIEDYVIGTGLHEIEYVGSWAHSQANALVGGTNTYTVMADDCATLRFEGTTVRLYMVTQQNQGMVAVSVDGGDAELADCYSPSRQRGVLVFESPRLPFGQHTIRVTSTNTKNPESNFFWTSVDRFEVDADE